VLVYYDTSLIFEKFIGFIFESHGNLEKKTYKTYMSRLPLVLKINPGSGLKIVSRK